MKSSIRNGAAIGAIFLAALLAACAGGGESTSSIPISGGSAPGPIVAVPQAIIPVSTASPGTFKMYALGSLNGGVVATGPDRLYFVNTSPKSIGWLTYGGAADTVPAGPSDGSTPFGLVEGADGAMYFGESGSGLGKLVPNVSGGGIGTFTEWNDFGVTTAGTTNVISDQQGILWYTENNNNSVVRMTTWGSLLSRTALSAGADPFAIAMAPNGTVWVTEHGTNKIAQLTSAGTLTAEYSVTSGSGPDGIATDSAGNAYFTEDAVGVQNYVGKVTPAGVVTMTAAPASGDLSGIAQGPDGNIWFSEHAGLALVQYNVSTGILTAHALPGGYGQPQGIASGADGQLWIMVPGSGIASYHP